VFEQLSNAIGKHVMDWQSESKKVAHAGIKDKKNPGTKGVNGW